MCVCACVSGAANETLFVPFVYCVEEEKERVMSGEEEQAQHHQQQQYHSFDMRLLWYGHLHRFSHIQSQAKIDVMESS